MSIVRDGSFFEDPTAAIYDYGTNAPGSLSVSNGSVFTMTGTFRGATSMIGQNPGGQGLVTITGTGSRIDMIGAGNENDIVLMKVGRLGGNGQLEVTEGGRLTITETVPDVAGVLRIGVDPGSQGAALFDQGGSFDLTTNGFAEIMIGRDGGSGSLVLQNGATGRLANTNANFGAHMEVGFLADANGQPGQGLLSVTSGSELEIDGARDGWLLVGGINGAGSVLVDDAEINITGANGAGLRVATRFTGNDGGQGAVTLQNGARVNIDGAQNSDLFIAGSEGSSGLVRVLSGSVIDTAANGNLRVGRTANNTEPGGEARLEIAGTGSLVQGLRIGAIGAEGGRGEAVISDGGWLRFGYVDMERNVSLEVGRNGGDGRLAIDGGLVSLQAGNGTDDDGNGFEPYLSVGRDGGTGLLEITQDPDTPISQGLIVIGGAESGFAGIEIGRGAGGDGTALLDGGFLWLQNVGRTFGDYGSGVFDLPGDGGLGRLRIGREEGTGRVEARNGAEVNNLATESAITSVGLNNGDGTLILDASSLVTRSEAQRAGLEIAWGGGAGEVVLRNGAEAIVDGRTEAYVDVGRFGSTSDLRLEGGSDLAVTAALSSALITVGRDDALGTLTAEDGSRIRIESGGDEHSAVFEVGRNSAEMNEAIFRSGAALEIEAARFANLVVGSEGGAGRMLVDDASVAMTGPDTSIRIGTRFSNTPDSTGDGRLTLQNGAELTMAPSPGSGGLRVAGDGGTGVLEVLSGATMAMGGSEMLIGVAHVEQTPGGLGTLLLDGEGSRISGARGLNIGGNGATGTATVSDGAQLAIGGTGLDNWTWLEVGRGEGSDGTLVIDHALAAQQGANGLRPGLDEGWTPYTVIGRDGGTGRMEVSGARGIDPEAGHGYIQLGGADADFSTIDIGRGAGADGTVTVRGAFFGSQNDGTAFAAEPPFGPIDLPGDGGGAVLRIGVEGATGALTAEENSEIFAQSGSASHAAVVIGTTGGTGTAALTGGTLDIFSGGDRGMLFVGVGEGDGTLSLDGTAAVVRAGGSGTVAVGRDALIAAGFGSASGSISVTGGAMLDLRAEAEAQIALLELGAGGSGSLRIAGADSRVTLTGPETRVDMASGAEGGTAMLQIVEGGLLDAGDLLVAGHEDSTEGSRQIVLDGGTLIADSLQLRDATLMGAGVLNDPDPGNGFAALVDSRLLVGTALEDGAPVAGRGDLSVVGDVALTGGELGFTRLAGADPDQLLIAGGLSLSGTTLTLDWQGPPPDPGTPGEFLLASASGGITLADVTFDTTLEDVAVTHELRAGGTELWAVAGDAPPPVVTVSGSIQARSGAAMPDVAVTFTPDSDGANDSTTTDATGSFSLALEPGASGALTAERDHGPEDPGVTIASAIDVLRLALGLPPSWGSPATALDFIAADFTGDGRVGVGDAIEMLRVALNLPSDHAARWLFLDAEADLSAIDRSNTRVDEGLQLGPLTADTQDLALTGVLIGHLQDFA